VTDTIKNFAKDSEYFFLSNFYEHPLWVSEKQFKSGEHSFQYFKMATDVGREAVLAAITPGLAKKAGRSYPMRPDWDRIKVGVMFDVVSAKFDDMRLKHMLLNTGDATLVEGNTWGDDFWGVVDGKGANWLGRKLMIVRSRLEATI
jgi:ribA/ribD-fused uncharacterized protein